MTETIIETLRFYADPDTYRAITILADSPAGEFMDDFSDDHGDDFFRRPMPGKRARDTLAKLGIPLYDEADLSDNPDWLLDM